jgi:adenosylcobinamide-phosphate synthase
MIDFITELHSQILDPERFPIAMFAMLLTAIIGMITGPMHGNANPFFWKIINLFFGGIGKRLDRIERKASDLMFRGLILTIAVLSFSYVVGSFLSDLVIKIPYNGFTEILFLSLVITSGTVWYGLLRLYFAVRDNSVSKGAYYTIARSSRTDLSTSDEFTITRNAMGYAAKAFDKGLVSPVFWYLLAGLPGAYIYAGLSAVSWRFGREGSNKGFGAVPMALEKLMGFAPMFLSGVLVAAAGLFTPTGGMTRAYLGMLKEEGRAVYEQGGISLTAMAYALNVSLGGPVTDLDGRSIKRNWVGPKQATAKLENAHLRRCIYIMLMAFLLFLVSMMFSLLYGRLFF